jgi:hypothetical protein
VDAVEEVNMNHPARSIMVFGIYLILLAAVMVIIPNFLLATFGLPTTEEVWVRVAGMVIGFLGCYYIQAARHNLTPFFYWTVSVRASVILFFTAFVLLGYAKPMLIMFGGVDMIGAIWTGLALRQPPVVEKQVVG